MIGQLRTDIINALSAASERVSAHHLGDPDLTRDVTRWVDGPARFIEPHPLIREARQEALAQVGQAAQAIEQASEHDVHAASVARAHAIEAISRLQIVMLTHGRVSTAAERVGLGNRGDPI